jgi:hypothetical protein
MKLRELGSPELPAEVSAAPVPAEAFEELGRRMSQLVAEDELLTGKELCALARIPVSRWRALEPAYLAAGLRFLTISPPGARHIERRYSRRSMLGLVRSLYEEASRL